MPGKKPYTKNTPLIRGVHIKHRATFQRKLKPRARQLRKRAHQLEREFAAMMDAVALDGKLDLTVATFNTIAGPTREKA